MSASSHTTRSLSLHHWHSVLACPQTKQPLIFDEAGQRLISVAARCSYPVRSGIPILLIEEAKPLSAKDLKKYQTT